MEKIGKQIDNYVLSSSNNLLNKSKYTNDKMQAKLISIGRGSSSSSNENSTIHPKDNQIASQNQWNDKCENLRQSQSQTDIFGDKIAQNKTSLVDHQDQKSAPQLILSSYSQNINHREFKEDSVYFLQQHDIYSDDSSRSSDDDFDQSKNEQEETEEYITKDLAFESDFLQQNVPFDSKSHQIRRQVKLEKTKPWVKYYERYCVSRRNSQESHQNDQIQPSDSESEKDEKSGFQEEQYEFQNNEGNKNNDSQDEEILQSHEEEIEEDPFEIKTIFKAILGQIRSHARARRIRQMRNQFEKSIRKDLIVRSSCASRGGDDVFGEIGSQKLEYTYLSQISNRVFQFKDKYTGMTLLQYACNFPCLKFIKAFSEVNGMELLIEGLCEQSQSGKNGFHFLAQAHAYSELALIWAYIEKYVPNQQLEKASQEVIQKRLFVREISLRHRLRNLVAQSLKQIQNVSQGSCLHLALESEFEVPEELQMEFEENYDLQEDKSVYKNLNYKRKLTQISRNKVKERKQLISTQIDSNVTLYSFVKGIIKTRFCRVLIKFLERLQVCNEMLFQIDSNFSTPVEIAQKGDMCQIIQRILQVDPSIAKCKFGNQNTLLHFAAASAQPQMTNLLLKKMKTSDVQIRNIFDQTPFDTAFYAGNAQICEILRKHLDSQQNSNVHDSLQFLEQQCNLDSNEYNSQEVKNSIITGKKRSDSNSGIPESIFKDVIVHLDFKGAPPKFDFLVKLIRYIATEFQYLVTGILFEFEDMFPFKGHLASIPCPKAYSEEQICFLITLCKENRLKVAILVQSFGHLEFVLKKHKYADFREEADNPISICSLREGALDLILKMMQQVIALVGSQNLDYLHIGADEVFNFASCQECRLFVQQANSRILFARWIKKIVKRLKRDHTNLNIMVWDDMFRSWNPHEFKLLKVDSHTFSKKRQEILDGNQEKESKLNHVLQPCIWAYSGSSDTFNLTISNQQIDNLCSEFDNIWVSSAFKGAKEPFCTFVDVEQRLQNQRLWIEKIQSSVLRQKSVRGIILTGWSRFTHQTVLCELLPMAIPSLNLTLSVLDRKQLTLEVLYSRTVDSLRIQPRKLIQGVEQIYQAISLRDFIDEKPWIQQDRQEISQSDASNNGLDLRDAQNKFCNDAFEIGWNLEKAIFLLDQVERTAKDWVCFDNFHNLRQNVSDNQQNFFPPRIANEIRTLSQEMLLKRAQIQDETQKQKLMSLEIQNTNLLKDSDSMDLDEESCLEEIVDQKTVQEQQKGVDSAAEAKADSLDNVFGKQFNQFQVYNKSSLGSALQDDKIYKKQFVFDFESRVNYILRMQLYRQLRGSIKLFKSAALKCEEILPKYMFQDDIQEFLNSKILPFLQKALQIQSSIFSGSHNYKDQEIKDFSKNDAKNIFQPKMNQKRISEFQIPALKNHSFLLQNQSIIKRIDTDPSNDEEEKALDNGIKNLQKKQIQQTQEQKQRNRICQTPDLIPRKQLKLDPLTISNNFKQEQGGQNKRLPKINFNALKQPIQKSNLQNLQNKFVSDSESNNLEKFQDQINLTKIEDFIAPTITKAQEIKQFKESATQTQTQPSFNQFDSMSRTKKKLTIQSNRKMKGIQTGYQEKDDESLQEQTFAPKSIIGSLNLDQSRNSRLLSHTFASGCSQARSRKVKLKQSQILGKRSSNLVQNAEQAPNEFGEVQKRVQFENRKERINSDIQQLEEIRLVNRVKSYPNQPKRSDK